MSDKELWELISIISEGQDSEQRRKVEQYITDLQKEIERLNNIINELECWLRKNLPIEEKNDLQICLNKLRGEDI